MRVAGAQGRESASRFHPPGDAGDAGDVGRGAKTSSRAPNRPPGSGGTAPAVAAPRAALFSTFKTVAVTCAVLAGSATVASAAALGPRGASAPNLSPDPLGASAAGPIRQAGPTGQPPPVDGRLSGTRVLELRVEPESPVFGEVFRVHVTIRVPRRSDLTLLDTLGSSNFFRSAGPGTWTEEEAPGDSLDVRAVFPVLPFRDGLRQLPGLLVEHGGAGAAPGLDSPPERVALGSVEVRPMAGFGPQGSGGPPRPPADVVGGSWSIWMILAAGTILLGVLGLARSLLKGGFGRAREAVSPPVEGTGALGRDEALRRLDEIRDAGWHRNGRIDDFYRASTDTLRRFVEGTDPAWNASLTSSELLDRAADRWGPSRLVRLPTTVERAEWVKFGGARPDPEDAEEDWTVIRNWIREAP